MQGRRAVIVAGAGAAILGLLLVFFLVLPKMNEVAQARQELEDTRAQQQTLSAQLNALRQARDEAPVNEAAIREVDGKVPPTADLPGVILFLRNAARSEEHTSELQSQSNLVCRLLLEKKK